MPWLHRTVCRSVVVSSILGGVYVGDVVLIDVEENTEGLISLKQTKKKGKTWL